MRGGAAAEGGRAAVGAADGGLTLGAGLASLGFGEEDMNESHEGLAGGWAGGVETDGLGEELAMGFGAGAKETDLGAGAGAGLKTGAGFSFAMGAGAGGSGFGGAIVEMGLNTGLAGAGAGAEFLA